MEAGSSIERTFSEAPRFVGAAPRAVAAIIDGILCFSVLGIPVSLWLGERTTVADEYGTTTFWTLDFTSTAVWFLLCIAYFSVFESLYGATIGKLVLSLRVRNSDGTPISFGQAVVRNVLRIVDCFPYFLPYFLGALSIWAGSDRQRIGDRVAATVVVWR